MKTLNTRIRDHVDALAEPIEFTEIETRGPLDAGPSQARWPVIVAASVVVLLGLGSIAFAVSRRQSVTPVAAPVVTPRTPTAPSTAAPTPTSANSASPTSTQAVRIVDVVVPAGATIDHIGELLAASIETVDASVFTDAAAEAARTSDFRPDDIDAAEGLLAAGSYAISEGDSEAHIAQRMVDAMNEIGAAANIAERSAALGRTPHEILTIASMIEREVSAPGDSGLLSRVIHNRLFLGGLNPENPFPLQIDSTVLYGVDQLGIDRNTPFSELRQIPSDWNTYVLPGLPLTPISSPSRDAIEAALNPTPNPGPQDPLCVGQSNPGECYFLFYVIADEDGSMVFGTNFEQHEANVRRANELGLL